MGMERRPFSRRLAVLLVSLLTAQTTRAGLVRVPALAGSGLAPISAVGAGLTGLPAAPTAALSAGPKTISPAEELPLAAPAAAQSPFSAAELLPDAAAPVRPAAATEGEDSNPSAVVQLQHVAKAWDKRDADLSALPVAANAPEGSALSRNGRIAAYVLDLDGNAFGPGFPTKIILFKKGGSEELPVTTADFAMIEGKVGTNHIYQGVNLKDYEIRAQGSFRNFHGRQIVEDLKYAAEKLPKAEWQGPSWPALVHALSDPETAPHFSVVSAREHAPEDVLEAFRYLQSAGYIKFLPKLENLHLVGSAADVPGRKAEVMASIADGLQASPFGEDASKVLNADGTAKAALHTVGFSDDTWANFEKMHDFLTTTIKTAPARWRDVKIVLFFTGKNDPQHAPVSIVLKSDGTTRPLTADESGEASLRHAESAARAPRREAPLPKPTEVRSPLASVGEAVKRMFVSHAYGNSDASIVDGDDLLARERSAIADFVADKSIANAEKHVLLTRYSVDDQELAQVLVAAKNAGIRVTLITDFNVSMDFKFKEGQPAVSDFSQATLKTSAPGAFLKTLLDAGFEIVSNGSTSEPRAAIYSQPLYNGGDPEMDPIMHEKSLFLVREAAQGERVLSYYFGTANLATHPRYNRVFQIDEPLSAAYGLDHAKKIMAAFRAGRTIAEIASEPPSRVWFEDESFMEAAYTNGKYNPNDRIIEVLKRTRLKKAWLSQFVLTNSNVVGALKEAMTASPASTLFGVFDDKFIPLDGYGKAAVMDGFMTAPPQGKNSWGWPSELTKRTTLLSYLRGVDGQVETDLEGPPLARHLWHDKTTLLLVEEDGKDWYYLFTGSLNNSNHVANAELQFMFRLPAGSPWAQAVVDSIEKTAAREKEYAVPLELGIMRDAVAAMAGLSPLYVAKQVVEAVVAAATAKTSAAVEAALQSLVEQGSRILGDKFAPKPAQERLQKFVDFLNWHRGEREAGRISSSLTIRKLAALATVIARPGMKPASIRAELEQVLWEKGLSEAQMETRLGAAWKALGIKSPLGPPGGNEGTFGPPKRVQSPNNS